jgi:two-component system, OmpR family, response regulator
MSAMLAIAVIDDEALICELVAEVLGDFGLVHCASTGAAGAALLAGKRFDLAFIDIVLPDVSGFALAEIASNENTPVLLTTGHPDALVRLKELDLPYLPKPFDLARLRTEAAGVIAESRANVQRVKAGLAQLRESRRLSEEALVATGRLMAVSRGLAKQAAAVEPSAP